MIYLKWVWGFFFLLQEMERINLKGTDFSTMMHSDMLSKTVLGFIMLSKYFSTFPLSFCFFFFLQIELTSFYFGNHKFWLELIYVRSILFLCLLAKIKLFNGPIKLSHYHIGMFIGHIAPWFVFFAYLENNNSMSFILFMM